MRDFGFFCNVQVQIANPHTSNENLQQVIGNLQRRNRPELDRSAVESSRNYFTGARIGMLQYLRSDHGDVPNAYELSH